MRRLIYRKATFGAPGMNRTCDLRFRKPLLYPLSYGSGDGAKCGAKFAATPHVIYKEVTGAGSESKEHPPKVYISKIFFLCSSRCWRPEHK